MFRTFFIIIFFIIYLILTIIPLIYITILRKMGKMKESDKLSYDIVQNISSLFLKFSGAKVNVIGQENLINGPVVFVSNHQGDFDILVYLKYLQRPVGFVAKKELLKVPIVNLWMKYINCVFVDRKNARQGLKTINKAVEIIKDGHSILIFPEGTRSKSRNMRNFKNGSFKIALKTGVPIIPLVIDGSYKLFEANNRKIKGANVDVKICKPIYIDEIDVNNSKELSEKVYQIIETELKNLAIKTT